MRMKFTRDFYIPKDSEKIESDCGAVAYLTAGNRHNGAPYWHAVAFHGKAEKPDFNYTFKTEAQAREYVATHASNVRAHKQRIAEEKAKRRDIRAADHFKVGDLIRTSWGYDQTNVEFFKIVRVLDKTVEIVAIDRKTVPGSEGYMSCSLQPDPDHILTSEWETKYNGIRQIRPGWGTNGEATVCVHEHSSGYKIAPTGSTYCSWYA